MGSKNFGPFDGTLDDDALDLLQILIERFEPRVDKHLARLEKTTLKKSPEAIESRLNKVFLAAAIGAGATQGAGGASRKVGRSLAKKAQRASAGALLGAGVLYILARARVRGFRASDQEVQEALRSLIFLGASVPLAQGVIDLLGRFGRPSLGVPRDPRTVAVIAAGGAVGGWAGITAGQAIIDAVEDAFSGVVEGIIVDSEPLDEAADFVAEAQDDLPEGKSEGANPVQWDE